MRRLWLGLRTALVELSASTLGGSQLSVIYYISHIYSIYITIFKRQEKINLNLSKENNINKEKYRMVDLCGLEIYQEFHS